MRVPSQDVETGPGSAVQMLRVHLVVAFSNYGRDSCSVSVDASGSSDESPEGTNSGSRSTTTSAIFLPLLLFRSLPGLSVSLSYFFFVRIVTTLDIGLLACVIDFTPDLPLQIMLIIMKVWQGRGEGRGKFSSNWDGGGAFSKGAIAVIYKSI